MPATLATTARDTGLPAVFPPRLGLATLWSTAAAIFGLAAGDLAGLGFLDLAVIVGGVRLALPRRRVLGLPASTPAWCVVVPGCLVSVTTAFIVAFGGGFAFMPAAVILVFRLDVDAARVAAVAAGGDARPRGSLALISFVSIFSPVSQHRVTIDTDADAQSMPALIVTIYGIYKRHTNELIYLFLTATFTCHVTVHGQLWS